MTTIAGYLHGNSGQESPRPGARGRRGKYLKQTRLRVTHGQSSTAATSNTSTAGSVAAQGAGADGAERSRRDGPGGGGPGRGAARRQRHRQAATHVPAAHSTALMYRRARHVVQAPAHQQWRQPRHAVRPCRLQRCAHTLPPARRPRADAPSRALRGRARRCVLMVIMHAFIAAVGPAWHDGGRREGAAHSTGHSPPRHNGVRTLRAPRCVHIVAVTRLIAKYCRHGGLARTRNRRHSRCRRQ